jgi:hypothetical protein
MTMQKEIITDLYQMGLSISKIVATFDFKSSDVRKIIHENNIIKYSSTYPKNYEFIIDYISRKNTSPIRFQNEDVVVLKRYYRQRTLIDDQVTFNYVPYEANPKYIVFPRKNFNLNVLKDIFDIQHCTFENKWINYLKLKNVNNEFVNISNANIRDFFDAFHVNTEEFINYLENIKIRNTINRKLTSIVNDRFRVRKEKVSPTTNAIFSNIGYLIKDYEGKYLDMSVGDKTFLRKFFSDRIIDGTFVLTLTETFPLYKEEIKDIIKKGRILISLDNNKSKIKSTSLKVLGATRKTLESCWQVYFEKYLKLFFMSYKFFAPQASFKRLEGYLQETRPDFLAIDLYNNIDVIEIKHHRTPLFVYEEGRDSIYPSSELTKSIYQLTKYLDLNSDYIKIESIKDDYVRDLFKNKKLYRPKGVLIVSSRNFILSDMDDRSIIRIEKEIKKLKSTYNNVDILLFDELLESLEKYVEKMELTFNK